LAILAWHILTESLPTNGLLKRFGERNFPDTMTVGLSALFQREKEDKALILDARSNEYAVVARTLCEKIGRPLKRDFFRLSSQAGSVGAWAPE
jgi:hypothetical protein